MKRGTEKYLLFFLTRILLFINASFYQFHPEKNYSGSGNLFPIPEFTCVQILKMRSII